MGPLHNRTLWDALLPKDFALGSIDEGLGDAA
eukprot:SAG31_NODE_34903_length_328_cov_0.676856_1_plen_31_part_10